MLQVNVVHSPEQVAAIAAERIAALVKLHPAALLCLAGGETPRLTYRYLVEKAMAGAVDFSHAQFVSLDEWVGIPKSNSGSCYYFLEETLFAPLAIPAANIHFFDATSADLRIVCRRIDTVMAKHKQIVFMLLGIGMNGHIGFNEPGIDANLESHVIELDPLTTQVGQKYFTENTPLRQGITLGMAHVRRSKQVLLLATGAAKALIIKKTLEESATNLVPASLLQQHTDAMAVVDAGAASLLKIK